MIDPNLLKVAEKLGVPGDFYIKDATKVCLSAPFSIEPAPC